MAEAKLRNNEPLKFLKKVHTVLPDPAALERVLPAAGYDVPAEAVGLLVLELDHGRGVAARLLVGLAAEGAVLDDPGVRVRTLRGHWVTETS